LKLGLFTPVFAKLSLDELLVELRQYPAITSLELGAGGWPGASHLDVASLLASGDAAKELKSKIADAGLEVSALSCHNNPVHPDPAVAARDHEVFARTVRAAERLGVNTVVTFSGCPGGGPEDRTPNWITAAWPPEFGVALEWQWNERLIPYWRGAMKTASDAGVRVALEAHPGFSVYNPETMLKLRHAVSDDLGINLDPSHLWWQQMEISAAIEALEGAIFHVHAKDVVLNRRKMAVNGVLDTKSYSEMADRSWLFRSVGWGHDETAWKEIVSALRLAGYDGVLSIEHEDALASIHEGLSSAVNFLEQVLLKEKAVEPWWV
jgi:sugar phosphate isomerase/epimerase